MCKRNVCFFIIFCSKVKRIFVVKNWSRKRFWSLQHIFFTFWWKNIWKYWFWLLLLRFMDSSVLNFENWWSAISTSRLCLRVFLQCILVILNFSLVRLFIGLGHMINLVWYVVNRKEVKWQDLNSEFGNVMSLKFMKSLHCVKRCSYWKWNMIRLHE